MAIPNPSSLKDLLQQGAKTCATYIVAIIADNSIDIAYSQMSNEAVCIIDGDGILHTHGLSMLQHMIDELKIYNRIGDAVRLDVSETDAESPIYILCLSKWAPVIGCNKYIASSKDNTQDEKLVDRVDYYLDGDQLALNPQKKNWWKEGVMYQIYPRSFKDSNHDGIGDIRGIIEKVDHLASLGIDMIWLCPVYASPLDDNGYDISDYYSIHPDMGSMQDLEELVQLLHQRGIRLIMDLVLNHTSDEHEWFEQASSSIDSPLRDYYFWKKPKADGGPPNNWKAFFGGSAWKQDPKTEEYYLHLFTEKQPDLNWENESLRKELHKIMKFWLDKGVDGFRMDVISLISKKLAFEDSPVDEVNYMIDHYYSNGPRIHEFLQEMNREVLQHYDIMTVGEGPGIYADTANDYVGKDRGELNMVFQIELMFADNGPGGKFDYQPLSLVDFKAIMNKWDAGAGSDGWNNVFLDNHDFPRLVSRYGNDKEYRRESTKMLLMYLFALRGTPCIYNGTEMGMTNVAFEELSQYRDIESLNYIKAQQAIGTPKEEMLRLLHIQSRDNVRTPLQWSDNPPFGSFSTVKPWIDVNGNYKYINVDHDSKDPKGIAAFLRRLIALKKSSDILIYGDQEEQLPNHDSLSYMTRRYEGQTLHTILNFSDQEQSIAELGIDGKLVLSNYGDTETIASPLQAWEARYIVA